MEFIKVGKNYYNVDKIRSVKDNSRDGNPAVRINFAVATAKGEISTLFTGERATEILAYFDGVSTYVSGDQESSPDEEEPRYDE